MQNKTSTEGHLESYTSNFVFQYEVDPTNNYRYSFVIYCKRKAKDLSFLKIEMIRFYNKKKEKYKANPKDFIACFPANSFVLAPQFPPPPPRSR